jgi:hypothetical protein
VASVFCELLTDTAQAANLTRLYIADVAELADALDSKSRNGPSLISQSLLSKSRNSLSNKAYKSTALIALHCTVLHGFGFGLPIFAKWQPDFSTD